MNETAFCHNVGDRFQISPIAPSEEVLARFAGGFGAVYVVRSLDSTKTVTALKTVRADLVSSERMLDGFAKEAELWAALPRHPNILPVYETRRHNSRPYVRMKYVPPVNEFGSSLSAVLHKLASDNAALGANGVVYFTSQLLGILEFLEREVPGFVHCDIKPANMLIQELTSETPMLLLSDFGLARAALVAGGVQYYGGDLSYLAPEVRSGAIPGTRSDMYSLGCSLFELMVSRPFQIYDRATASTLRALPEATTRALIGLRPDIPEGLHRLVSQCLAHEPSERPATYHALLQDFISMLKNAGGHIIEKRSSQGDGPAWIRDVSSDPLHTYLVNVRKLTANEAEDVLLELSRAADLRGAGRLVEAEQRVDQVLVSVPEFAPALQGKAFGLSISHDPKRALPVYYRALAAYAKDPQLIEADPRGYASACATLAQLLAFRAAASSEELEKALVLAKTAAEFMPENAKVQMTLGVVLLMQGQFANAVKTLEDAAHIDPSNLAIRGNLVVAIALTHEHPMNALDALLTEHQVQPRDYDFIRNAVQTLERKKHGHV